MITINIWIECQRKIKTHGGVVMTQFEYGRFLTADPRMQRILQLARNVATSKASVMITGESGTGKELLAQFIHENSPRASRRMVAINCAAVPEGLLESELFGFEKGAFTGAVQSKPGKFELANDGTLLLDEMGELPLHLQAKLLRVLQEGEVERLGSKQVTKINVRVIATTNRNLVDMIRAGQFREDLYYRLNVIPMEIPALRNRPRDIDLLSKHFIEVSCLVNNKPKMHLSEEALMKLRQWSWPGNVRELENVIERVVLLNNTSVILPEHFQEPIPRVTDRDDQLKAGMTISEAEKYLILKTLDYTNQNRTKAARMLGISIRTLRNKLNEYREVHA